MKIPSVTFVCDQTKCDARHVADVWTSLGETEMNAYLDLVEHGWKVERPVGGSTKAARDVATP
jgi:hypothetical protein